MAGTESTISGQYDWLLSLAAAVPPAPSHSLTSLLTAPIERPTLSNLLYSPQPSVPNSSLASLFAPLPTNALTVPSVASTPAAALPWAYVTRRFDQLIGNMGILQDEIDDGQKKAMRVVGSLNRAYYDQSSGIEHAFLLGSWSKQTRVRPFSDLDLMFVLPNDQYWRFENHIGNKQSNLLQDVRSKLQVTYPRTEIWGDRHVVAVEVDGVLIEVVPAFELNNGQYWVCDTKDSGRYKLADPAAEHRALNDAAQKYGENAQQLTRLLKKWQIKNDVAIKAFQLERLAIEFLDGWAYSKNDRFYYDWMMRDVFIYMIGRANGFVQMPGTYEWIALGAEWVAAASTAYANAFAACAFEQANNEAAAGRSWVKVFGSAIPVSVS